MNTATAPPIIRIRFILRSHVRLYFVHERAAGIIGERHESVYAPDAGRTVCIWVVDDADDTALAGPNELICRRHGTAMTRHAEGALHATIRPHDKGRRAHAGG